MQGGIMSKVSVSPPIISRMPETPDAADFLAAEIARRRALRPRPSPAHMRVSAADLTTLASTLAWSLEQAGCGAFDARTTGALIAAFDAPAQQLAQACRSMDLASPVALETPDKALLPLLCRTRSRGWGLVVGRSASGLWTTCCESGDIHFSELALRGVCFELPRARHTQCPGGEVSGAPAALPGERARRPAPIFAAAMCVPSIPLGWESLGTGALLLATLFLGLLVLRLALRAAQGGRWKILSRWRESQHVARERERFLRQAILSSRSFQAPTRPDGRRGGPRPT